MIRRQVCVRVMQCCVSLKTAIYRLSRHTRAELWCKCVKTRSNLSHARLPDRDLTETRTYQTCQIDIHARCMLRVRCFITENQLLYTYTYTYSGCAMGEKYFFAIFRHHQQ